MAGIKGRSGGPRLNSGGARENSGGARSGAGRKKKSAANQPIVQEPTDMLTLLQNVALGVTEATALQVRAAIAAVQYTHTKRADGGKKEEKQEAAKAVAGRFAQAAPPKLAAAGGKRV